MKKITVNYGEALDQLITAAIRGPATAKTQLIGRILADAADQHWPITQLEGVIAGIVFTAEIEGAYIGVDAAIALDTLDQLPGMEV